MELGHLKKMQKVEERTSQNTSDPMYKLAESEESKWVGSK